MAEVTKLHQGRPARNEWDVDAVLEELRVSREVTHNIRHGGHVQELPNPGALLEVLEQLGAVLFPAHLSPAGLSGQGASFMVRNDLVLALSKLSEQIRRGLKFEVDAAQSSAALKVKSRRLAQEFAQRLPAIRASLVADLRAAYDADPSAGTIAEILLCSRGASAMLYHRIAHALHELGARMVASIIADLAHATTGIHIHPAARIADGFVAQGTSISIGETAVIGRNVRVGAGVTLGALPVSRAALPLTPVSRHPIVGDNVTILPGATILGPVTVEDGTIVPGNAALRSG